MTTPKNTYIDPSTGNRIYLGEEPSKRYISVTSGLEPLPKPWLAPWVAKATAEVAVELMQELEAHYEDLSTTHPFKEYLDELGTDGVDWELLAKDLAKAYEWERDGAGGLGDKVHEGAEKLMNISGGNAKIADAHWEAMEDGEAKTRLDFLIKWMYDNEIVVYAVEPRLFNDTDGYAGSCDLIAYVNGVLYVVDYKTSRQFDALKFAPQIAAYANAEYMLDDDDKRIPLPPEWDEARGAVLHLQPTKARFVEVDISDPIFDCFRASLLLTKMLLDSRTLKGEVLYDTAKREGSNGR